MTKGARNLLIMGGASVLIALLTTSVSLAWYHNSGDIYLDRSRPGYLPDDTEIDVGDPEADFNFSENGTISEDDLDEYLKAYGVEQKAVNEYKGAFSAEALSDEALGLEILAEDN